MKNARRRLGALGAALTAAACGGGAGVGGNTPTLVTPESPAVIVSFVGDALTVPEGETVEIGLQYRVNNLASPLQVVVSPLDLSAAPPDYELSSTKFEIPAGQGTSGAAALSLTALGDNQISEGDEMLSLRLVEPPGVRAQLGQDLEITIADTHASPCSGTEVLASPVVPLASSEWLTTTVRVRQRVDAARAWFEWEGPHYFRPHYPALEVHLVEWRIESSSDWTNHSMDIEWRESSVVPLRFRSPDGACAGEPVVACTSAGCELGQ